MKNLIKWKFLLITCAVCLLPVIPCIILWNKLPETIAIHFDINNVPDGFASKEFTVFGLPLMMVVLQLVCCLINDINAKKYGERKKLERATKWIIPVMTIILQTITIAYAFGVMLDVRRWAMGIVGVIFLIIGNYLPKLDYMKNSKADKEQARRINRFVGFGEVIMGILALVTLFFSPIFSVIWLFLLIPYAAISVGYGIMVVKGKI